MNKSSKITSIVIFAYTWPASQTGVVGATVFRCKNGIETNAVYSQISKRNIKRYQQMQDALIARIDQAAKEPQCFGVNDAEL